MVWDALKELCRDVFTPWFCFFIGLAIGAEGMGYFVLWAARTGRLTVGV